MGSVYLIDFENVHTAGMGGIEELTKKDSVIVFCRENDVYHLRIFLAEKKVKCKVGYVLVTSVTKNAMDFEIVSFLGQVHAKDIYYIISEDKGYDVAIEFFMGRKKLCFRKKSIVATEYETFFRNFGKEKEVLSIQM